MQLPSTTQSPHNASNFLAKRIAPADAATGSDAKRSKSTQLQPACFEPQDAQRLAAPQLPYEIVDKVLGYLWSGYEPGTKNRFTPRLVSHMWRHANDRQVEFRDACAQAFFSWDSGVANFMGAWPSDVSPKLAFLLQNTSQLNIELPEDARKETVTFVQEMEQANKMLLEAKNLRDCALSVHSFDFETALLFPWQQLIGIEHLKLRQWIDASSLPAHSLSDLPESTELAHRSSVTNEPIQRRTSSEYVATGLKSVAATYGGTRSFSSIQKLTLERMTSSKEQARSVSSLLQVLPGLKKVTLFVGDQGESQGVDSVWLPWAELAQIQTLHILGADFRNDMAQAFRQQMPAIESSFSQRQSKIKNLVFLFTDNYGADQFMRHEFFRLIDCFSGIKNAKLFGGAENLYASQVSWHKFTNLESLVIGYRESPDIEEFIDPTWDSTGLLERDLETILRARTATLRRLDVTLAYKYNSEQTWFSSGDTESFRLQALPKSLQLSELVLHELHPQTLKDVRDLPNLIKLDLQFVGPLALALQNLDLGGMRSLREVKLSFYGKDELYRQSGLLEREPKILRAMTGFLNRCHRSIEKVLIHNFRYKGHGLHTIYNTRHSERKNKDWSWHLKYLEPPPQQRDKYLLCAERISNVREEK